MIGSKEEDFRIKNKLGDGVTESYETNTLALIMSFLLFQELIQQSRNEVCGCGRSSVKSKQIAFAFFEFKNFSKNS